MTAAARGETTADWYAEIADFASFGVRAFTTTRAAGSFALGSDEPAGAVTGRWDRLLRDLAPSGPRLAFARQVHGNRVHRHGTGWEGWLRCGEADGHLAIDRGIGVAVSIADCVPVFIAHPSGAIALLHSGWRGTAGRIIEVAIDECAARGMPAPELVVHLGPAICGRCYEVSPDVYEQVTGRTVSSPTPVDLRATIADQARLRGVRRIAISDWCTRCHNDRFFSHRAGDAGRQLGVMIAAS